MVARASRGGAEGRWAERWWAAGGAEGWQVEQSDRCARAQRRRRRRPRRSRVRRRSHRVVGVEVGAESAALALDDAAGRDKPDTKRDVFADLGSTVSLLRLRPGAAATSSSSSSSAGSAKSPTLCNAGAGVGRGGGWGSHSGELVVEGNPPRPPRHRRSRSGRKRWGH
ncbi:Os02g0434932 [Oryza sativa Japonica Group]|uniref:Os02g0434932 protein n=1 Tax=Oryza sativa subsp. japonica TaxID=39947 RepID=A0A0P0VIG8_ORYSJ|nr:Os02g0434932 [Oryza sativa Japonica Group]